MAAVANTDSARSMADLCGPSLAENAGLRAHGTTTARHWTARPEPAFGVERARSRPSCEPAVGSAIGAGRGRGGGSRARSISGVRQCGSHDGYVVGAPFEAAG